jgi:hypothetical protein
MTTQIDDSVLYTCNETELLALAKAQGLGHLRRGLPKDLLVRIVRGEEDPAPEHYADTKYSRKMLEDFIARYWDKCRSQLPGCNGKCTTFPCSEGRHALCFEPNKNVVGIK